MTDPQSTATQSDTGGSLSGQLSAFAATVNRPSAAKEAINEAFERIEASGAVPGLELGAQAPDFTLPNALGQQVSLSDRLAEGPVVLTFYRGSWCPYCNLELKAYQELLPEFTAAGARLIAISPQRPDDALSMQEKNELGFDVLSDVEQSAIEAFRIRFELPPEVIQNMMESTLEALARQQPDGKYSLTVPATFVIDRDGTIRSRHVSMAYRTRMEPAEALRVVRELA